MLYAVAPGGPDTPITLGPVTEQVVRAHFDGVSLPQVIDLQDFPHIGLFRVPELSWPKPVGATTWVVLDTPAWVSGALVRTFKEEVCPPERWEAEWVRVRSLRNKMLLDCDWTDLPSAPLAPSLKIDWQQYRQMLRDLTEQPNPFNLSWPSAPA